MTVKQFVTRVSKLTITINKETNGSYTAFEHHTREEGGNVQILHSWCLDWLIDTLHMYYIPEALEKVF